MTRDQLRAQLVCLLCLIGLGVQGQTTSKQVRRLEKQRTDLLRKIEQTDQELRKTRQDSKAGQRQLSLTQEQVKQRKQVITVLEEELKTMQQIIDSLGGELVSLRGRERHLLDQYTRSIRALSGRTSDVDRLAFLFSAQSAQEALLRHRFLSSYAVATSHAASEVKVTRQRIEETQEEINATHRSKAALLELRDGERRKLEAQEGQQRRQVAALKEQERKLQNSLERQRRAAQQLDSKIQAQIEAEIRAAEERARREREQREAAARRRQEQKLPPTASSPRPKPDTPEDSPRSAPPSHGSGYASSSEDTRLTGSFQQNKGRLPMPVRGRYDIVRRFGLQSHDTNSRLRISSGGINIRAYNDRNAYAVFDGVVSNVFLSEYGQSILLRHGNYFTVYTHLSSVRVSPGQRVSARQAIGTISAEGDADRSNILTFQIRHLRTKLDPQKWLQR